MGRDSALRLSQKSCGWLASRERRHLAGVLERELAGETPALPGFETVSAARAGTAQRAVPTPFGAPATSGSNKAPPERRLARLPAHAAFAGGVTLAAGVALAPSAARPVACSMIERAA